MYTVCVVYIILLVWCFANCWDIDISTRFRWSRPIFHSFTWLHLIHRVCKYILCIHNLWTADVVIIINLTTVILINYLSVVSVMMTSILQLIFYDLPFTGMTIEQRSHWTVHCIYCFYTFLSLHWSCRNRPTVKGRDHYCRLTAFTHCIIMGKTICSGTYCWILDLCGGGKCNWPLW